MAIQRAIGELESAKETVQGLHRDAADMKLRKIDEAIEFIKGWLL
jgi:hypothetical protein